MVKYREMTESDNAAVASLVRDNLKHFNLDIPGTVYFDILTSYVDRKSVV